jgi:hypothetical protein
MRRAGITAGEAIARYKSARMHREFPGTLIETELYLV